MKVHTFTDSDLTTTGNQLKEVFLEKMVKENEITQELADKLNNYCFVIAEKGLFGKIWDKIFFKENKESKIVVVKII